MLGGGIFTKQDKVLPGSYINFVSAGVADRNASLRGVAAMPLTLGWGPEGKVVTLTKEQFERESLELLGYPADSAELLPFREIFRNALVLHYDRLNRNTMKASNDFAEARYGGIRGNALKTIVQKNVDNASKYDVKTVLGTLVYETQTVDSAADLKDNPFIVFKKDAVLEETAGKPFTGGTDGDTLTGAEYQGFLDKIETYSFHVLGCPAKDEQTVSLFIAFTKRMRDELGIKFQTVVYKAIGANCEGIISVDNKASESETGLVYWTAGLESACAINKSTTNRIYDGEYTVNTAYTQMQLEDGIKAGKFLFHKVGSDIRVLSDINTLTIFTEEKEAGFADNQTIRILDQMGNDIAGIFANQYMGRVPNDDAGRTSLWNDIVTYQKELVKQRAIESFESKDIKISAGESKKSVVVSCPVTPQSCMSQLYMTIVVA